jgi:hypothetical protein
MLDSTQRLADTTAESETSVKQTYAISDFGLRVDHSLGVGLSSEISSAQQATKTPKGGGDVLPEYHLFMGKAHLNLGNMTWP